MCPATPSVQKLGKESASRQFRAGQMEVWRGEICGVLCGCLGVGGAPEAQGTDSRRAEGGSHEGPGAAALEGRSKIRRGRASSGHSEGPGAGSLGLALGAGGEWEPEDPRPSPGGGGDEGCLGDAGCAWLHSPRGGPVTQVSSEDPAHPCQTPPSLVWGMAWTGSRLGEERAGWVQGRPRAFLGGVYEKSPG